MYALLRSHLARAAWTLALGFAATSAGAQTPGLVISEYLANPSGSDTAQEYVELVATRAIDFATTPYTVVFNNNGAATANGWRAGAALTYAFAITSGTVAAGDVVYVGGSGMAPTGTKLRTIDITTTGGDGGIGAAAATAGVLGNGGTNADGIAVFDVAVASLTSSSVPVDAIFFGTGIGSAVVSSGTAGYELPINDRYSGGKLQSTSFFALEPANGTPTHATGTLNTATGTWTTQRTWANAAASATSTITLVAGTPTPNLSINDVTANETDTGTTTFTFTVSLDAPAGAGGVTFDIATADDTAQDDTPATEDNDYVARSLTCQTIATAGQTYTFDVTVNGDNVYETDSQQFFVNVTNVTGATVTDGQGVGTINDDDPYPTLTATTTTSVTEGDSGNTAVNITYTLSNPADDDATIEVGTADGTATTADNDYTQGSSGTSIPAFATSVVYTGVAVVGDTTPEPDQTFEATVDNYYIGPGRLRPSGDPLPSTTITILDDDTTPAEFSIDSVSLTEGDVGTTNATFTVTLTAPLLRGGGPSYSVDYATAPGTATTGADFTATGGSLTFNASGTQTITVPVVGDLLDEPDETFTVTLSNASVNAVIVSATGTGTINDNDATPALSIDSVGANEGDVGTSNLTFTVTLDAASGQTVSVGYATADATATTGDNDYAAASGTLTFNPGVTSQTLSVAINGDTTVEPNETFLVNLSNAVNATFASTQGTGTIQNDDASADLSISVTDSPDPVNPGQNLTYVVTLTNAGPSNADGTSFVLPLPAGTTFVSLAAPGGWNCTTPTVGANGTVNCNDIVLRAAASSAKMGVGNAQFTIVANVDSSVAPGTLLTSSLTSTSGTSDPNGANNVATATTLVAAGFVPTTPVPATDTRMLAVLALLVFALAAPVLRRNP